LPINTNPEDLGVAEAQAIDTKTRIIPRFIQRKRAEYDALKAELEQLTAEAKADGLLDPETANP